MTSYSDEEVREAVAKFKEFEAWQAQVHGYKVEDTTAKIYWAAEQYLKAKPVIEWYADESKYQPTYTDAPLISGDEGQRAREFLGKK